MILWSVMRLKRIVNVSSSCRTLVIPRIYFSQDIENKYSVIQKEKIMKVINESDVSTLSGYDITKTKLMKFSKWRSGNGKINTLSDLELVDGFTKKYMIKLYDSILEGVKPKEPKISNKIKGQILNPTLNEAVRQQCKSVLAVYVNVNSVCWTLIDRSSYEVTKWTYHSIDYPDGKKLQITDIYDIASSVIQQLPLADIYVMKAEATTLRAAGSDPSNVKTIAVNLQKAQMIAMIVALLNARSQNYNMTIPDEADGNENATSQKVYFLRPSLPYRLYGTLVGNEKVSTDQTIEMLLQKQPPETQVKISDHLKSMFRSQKDLQKDMLGHSLLLGLTFMDLCIYRDQESIHKLMKRNE